MTNEVLNRRSLCMTEILSALAGAERTHLHLRCCVESVRLWQRRSMKSLVLLVLLGLALLADRTIGQQEDLRENEQLPPMPIGVDHHGHMIPSIKKNATHRPLLGRPDGHEPKSDSSLSPPEQQTEKPVIGRPDGHDEHGHSDEDLIGRPDGHDGHGRSDEDLIGRSDGHDGHGSSDEDLIGRPDGHDGHGRSDEDLIGRPDGHDGHGHSDEDLIGRPDGHDGHFSEEEVPPELGLDDGNEPLVRCKRPLCAMLCSLGFQTDASGCPICKCLEDPCQNDECRDGTVCHPIACESTRSCVELSAECIPMSRSCPEPMCANYCPNGYAHNAEGCMTCTCEMDYDYSPPEEVQFDDFPCPEVMCAQFCPTGYQRNGRGCMTCTCNNDNVQDPSCGDIFCEMGQVCRTANSKAYCAPKPMCLLAQEMAHMKRDKTRMFVPDCEDAGTFTPKQCHPLTSQCWCVDDRGKEVNGTRLTVTSGEEDQLQCKPSISVAVHMEMMLTFQDSGYYGDEDESYEDEDDNDADKDLVLNLDKSQSTLEDAFSQWLLVEKQYISVVKVEQNSKTTMFVQLVVKKGDLVDLPSAVEHMKRKMRMGHCTVPLENTLQKEEEVYFAPNPDTLNVEHQYNAEQSVMTEWPDQNEALDGRSWYKYCFGNYHILLAVATMLVLFMILALFSAVMVHRHRRSHRSLQFRHHKLENQLSHEQKNFVEGEVATDTQSESAVILMSGDDLEKKHPIA